MLELKLKFLQLGRGQLAFQVCLQSTCKVKLTARFIDQYLGPCGYTFGKPFEVQFLIALQGEGSHQFVSHLLIRPV